MKKQLKDLLSSVEINGITDDSRKMKKGFLFVAIKGLKSDGHNFIPQAIANGAKVIVGEKEPQKEWLSPHVRYVKVEDSREALGILASLFYGEPSEKLIVIGVTGTKGKTTTCHLIEYLLTTFGQKTGLISSITTPGFHVTTPDALTLQKTLKEMVDANYKYVVIEVSSHSIDQKRIAGVKFDIGVLTNIAPEHLDYHKTFEEYKRVKISFINSAKTKSISPEKTNLKILPGEFNNLNAETAIKVIETLGFDGAKAIEILHSFKLPNGRMEEIKNNRGIKIYLDFAHTPESLEAVLNYLRTKTKRKLIVVFGCAGERDPNKREKMGEIAGRIADYSVFTAEDPRSENVFDILGQMEKKAKNFVSIPERGEAIAHALEIAKRGDCLIITGKGHERSMAHDGFEHPWSDRKMVESLINPLEGVSAIIMAAGLGTRMNSELPKVLNKIAGRSVISLTLENLRRVGILDIVIVVGFKKELVIKQIGGAVSFAEQENPKGGTADAVKTGLSKVIPESKYILALYGDDSAFFKSETTMKVIQQHIKDNVVISFVSAELKNPFGLGRVIRDAEGKVIGIVEEKDTTAEQKKIKEINCGHFIFNKDWLEENIEKVKLSASGEYYIVDLIKMAIEQNKKVVAYKLPDPSEWHGINTSEELVDAEEKMKERLAKYGNH
jgi:UDP-N-acetylmuramoyl-L-alanyl-D-glutamate--2,6-diaminopimelate ligase